MKNGSVMARNLLGGFLGGIIGIFASWYVSPMALPFGVLIGVIVGWWSKDLICVIVEAHNQAQRAASGLVVATNFAISALSRFYSLPAVLVRVIYLIASTIAGAAFAVLLVPTYLKRRYVNRSRHPMGQSDLIYAAVGMLFLAGIASLMWLVERHLGLEKSNEGLLAIPGIFAAFGGIVVYHLKGIGPKEEINALGQFYRDWQIVDRYGLVGLAICILGKYLRHAIGIFVFFTLALPWLFICIPVVMLSAIPLVFAIVVARGFYQIANRSGHWLCFGVTMVVTVLSWLNYHSSFGDPRVLWVVALGTGVVSGGSTEIIRRTLLTLYSNTTIGQKIASSWANAVDLVVDDETGYLETGINRFGFVWFRQARLARMFRTFCFGTPVAQPVRII